MREWTDVCARVRDDAFMKRFTHGRPRFIPLHLAFVYSGKSLRSVASNVNTFGHAEQNCVRSLDRRTMKTHQRTTMIVVRISSDGSFSMSRPCYHCCCVLRHRLPRARVFYSDENGVLAEDVHLDNRHVSLSRRNDDDTVPKKKGSVTCKKNAATGAPS